METVIALDELTYIVESNGESITVLHPISLTVNPGEFLVITGPSGSGKTSLLRILGGLIEATSGSIEVCAEKLLPFYDATASNLRREKLAMVFQSNNLSKYLTLRENVELKLETQNLTVEQSKSLALEALAKVGIEHLADRYPDESSGGQQQRAGFARAIAASNQLLLCDEPSGSLDSENSRKLGELLVEIARSGTAVVVATHDPIIESFGTRVLKLRDGAIQE